MFPLYMSLHIQIFFICLISDCSHAASTFPCHLNFKKLNKRIGYFSKSCVSFIIVRIGFLKNIFSMSFKLESQLNCEFWSRACFSIPHHSQSNENFKMLTKMSTSFFFLLWNSNSGDNIFPNILWLIKKHSQYIL